MTAAFEFLLTALALTTGGPTTGVMDKPALIDALPMVWRIERQTNRKTGGRMCTVISLGDNVSVRFVEADAGGGPAVVVRIGYDNQPESLRYLRINRMIFQTAEPDFSGKEARDIAERLRLPGEYAFEWAARPDFAKRQGLFGTGNFADRADACLQWLGGVRT